MRSVFLSLFLLFPSSAYTDIPPESLTIQTQLTYRGPSKKDISVSKEMVIPIGNTQWLPLTDAKDQVVLLGRIAQTDGTALKVEYMLIDGHQKPSSVVSTPTILARLGEPAEISVADSKQKSNFSISLTAKKTENSPQSAETH
jgi:hypothetical protein